jgi:hypothetical protein
MSTQLIALLSSIGFGHTGCPFPVRRDPYEILGQSIVRGTVAIAGELRTGPAVVMEELVRPRR